jgi:uncharacterized protein with FMN-binding domain
MVRRLLISAAALAGLGVQAGPLLAADLATGHATAPKKKVTTVTKTVKGTTVKCDRWGFMQLALTVKQTVTIVGTTKKVTAVKITAITEPTIPTHTDRSIYINKQALPLLNQEVQDLQLKSLKLESISGATDSTVSFLKSLQAALLAAQKA